MEFKTVRANYTCFCSTDGNTCLLFRVRLKRNIENTEIGNLLIKTIIIDTGYIGGNPQEIR